MRNPTTRPASYFISVGLESRGGRREVDLSYKINVVKVLSIRLRRVAQAEGGPGEPVQGSARARQNSSSDDDTVWLSSETSDVAAISRAVFQEAPAGSVDVSMA